MQNAVSPSGETAFLHKKRVIGQNVLVLPYNPNFILWTLASLCLSSELVYIYLASHPISIYVVVLRSISVFGGIKRGIINPDRA